MVVLHHSIQVKFTHSIDNNACASLWLPRKTPLSVTELKYLTSQYVSIAVESRGRAGCGDGAGSTERGDRREQARESAEGRGAEEHSDGKRDDRVIGTRK